MKAKPSSSFAGYMSIVWMAGGYAVFVFIVAPGHAQVLPTWLLGLFLLAGWLGGGLVLGIAGFRRGNQTAQVCGLLSIIAAAIAALLIMSPFLFPSRRSHASNKPDAVNPAMTLRFAIDDHWRRVTDLGRSAALDA